jgi:replication factor C small subunit
VAIIPAISSRCLPFFFSPLKSEVVQTCLRSIITKECIPADCINDDDIELIIQAAAGDMRKAIMLLQVSASVEGDLVRSSQSETGQIAQAALKAITSRDIPVAIHRFEILMIEYGLTPSEVLEEFRNAVRKDYNDPKVVSLIAETDYKLTQCNNEYIQLNAMIARIAQEVFP